MTTPDELHCQELVEIVTDYIEGVMSPTERRRFEEHLRDCPLCLEYVEQFKRTVATVGTLRDEDIPAPAREQLLAVFRTWKQG